MTLDSLALERACFWMQQTILAEFTHGFVAHLRDRGYCLATISRYLRIGAHFGQWLGKRHLSASDIRPDLITTFLDHHLRRCHCRIRIDRDRKTVRAGLARLVMFLQELRLAPTQPHGQQWPEAIGGELDLFEEELDRVRGAARATRISQRRYVGEFLKWRFGGGPLDLGELSAQDIRRFLLERSQSRRSSTIGVIAAALRSYLRHLVLRGHPLEHLVGAIPRSASWSHATLPRHLTREQEDRFLQVPDRTRPSGRRDYAMLLLMCSLGLRVSSVAALTLDAIDWRRGILTLQGTKSRREIRYSRYPLSSKTLSRHI